MSNFPRGSEWRQWDLHVHSPASFHWDGPKFLNGGVGPHDEAIIDQMIEAMNAAKPAVFALMDYWCFDGWTALKRRLNQPGAPRLTKKVFPGIELRLCAPMQRRLNAHVIFSDSISEQQLLNFRGGLKLELTDEPLSDEGLINYARQLTPDQLRNRGFNKDEVVADEAIALKAGHETAELTKASYQDAIKKVPDNLAVGFMPFTTNDGLTKIQVTEHYAYVMSLFNSSPIFEAREDKNWNAFVGQKLPSNEAFFDAFQEGLGHKPRLPVSGSDAHRFTGDGTNDRRGYGDYPSGRVTWIKADPTWQGLMQAIKEPKKRCFIGTTPPKLSKINDHKSFYIERVCLAKVAGSLHPDTWFDGCNIELNSDLVAIIGNKGSGKSALADVIAVLGRSQEKAHFSFLKRDRFRGKSGEPARQFRGELHWKAGDPCIANLADDPAPDKVEMVKYIPQGRFEDLCNAHVSGSSSAFERELRDVIFSHIPSNQRLDALSFDQMVEEQERTVRAALSELRKNLGTTNATIVSIEDQLHPTINSNLEEQLALKELQLSQLQALKPQEIAEPSDQLTPDQEAASVELTKLAAQEQEREAKHKELVKVQSELATKRQAAKAAYDQVSLFKGQFDKFSIELAEELAKLGLVVSDVVQFEINSGALEHIATANSAAIEKCKVDVENNEAEKQKIDEARATASNALNEPQKLRQVYLEELRQWTAKIDVVTGDANTPDSKIGLETRLALIASLPERLEGLKAKRLSYSEAIYTVLNEQRGVRAAMFAPIQQLINDNKLIHEEYKLQFQANLVAFPDAMSETIFSIVKQNTGDLRGDDESRAVVKNYTDQFGFQAIAGAMGFIKEMAEMVEKTAASLDKDAKGVRSMLRKDRSPEEFYDYLFGLDYLTPKYTLLFQETPIEQLSPGQRGALLLIFYLLVDKGRNPIILDQPEENLDNETIVSLLVPVIEEAKRNRQIIMVTHNPNLAVVCDAEQIIAAKFDRRNYSKISYYSGSIEEAKSNKNVVDILEGTKGAFNNRGDKYF